LISVSDTGIGMDEKTKMKIFEPFFTTKEVGKGTGLGLSTVYGNVKQYDGFVTVYSEPGEGTAFHVYLPVATTPGEEFEHNLDLEVKGGTETILVAEDHDDSRRLIREVLESNGYSVIEAVDGADAVQKFTNYMDQIALLIVDVEMPRKNGLETYNEIKKIQPAMRVLFMSGYTGDIVLDKGIQEKEYNFIAKPLSPNTLLVKIREILDIVLPPATIRQ
jgi:CheY-like chemotaxis protein